jgi:hypothetical protein
MVLSKRTFQLRSSFFSAIDQLKIPFFFQCTTFKCEQTPAWPSTMNLAIGSRVFVKSMLALVAKGGSFAGILS